MDEIDKENEKVAEQYLMKEIDSKNISKLNENFTYKEVKTAIEQLKRIKLLEMILLVTTC